MTSSAVHHMTKAELAAVIANLEAKLASIPAAVHTEQSSGISFLSIATAAALDDDIQTAEVAIPAALSMAMSAALDDDIQTAARSRRAAAAAKPQPATKPAQNDYRAIIAAVVQNPEQYAPQPFKNGYQRQYQILPAALLACKPAIAEYCKGRIAQDAANGKPVVIGRHQYDKAAKYEAALWSRITVAAGFKATLVKKQVSAA